jgi:hypothetical protein
MSDDDDFASPGSNCHDCVVLEETDRGDRFESALVYCHAGTVRDPKYAQLTSEFPWSKVIKRAYAEIRSDYDGWVERVDINISTSTGANLNYGSFSSTVKEYPFDRRSFALFLKNWSHNNNRTMQLIVEYRHGRYVTVGDCPDCRILEEGIENLHWRAERFHCGAGKTESPVTAGQSFDIPNTWMIKRLFVKVDSDYNQPSYEFDFDLNQRASSIKAPWMRVTMYVEQLTDRRVCNVLLSNWSHDNNRTAEVQADYRQGKYTKP